MRCRLFEEYREKLTYYYNEVNQLTALKGKADTSSQWRRGRHLPLPTLRQAQA